MKYPVVLGNGFAMWDALDSRYWPTIYLVGPDGVIRRVHEGGMHLGTSDSIAFGKEIERLLAARGSGI